MPHSRYKKHLPQTRQVLFLLRFVGVTIFRNFAATKNEKELELLSAYF